MHCFQTNFARLRLKINSSAARATDFLLQQPYGHMAVRRYLGSGSYLLAALFAVASYANFVLEPSNHVFGEQGEFQVIAHTI